MNHVRTDPACVQHAEPTEETRGIICRLCVDLYHHRARGDDMTEQQTPTPIDPADIRPGDTFRVTYEAKCERVTPNGIIVAANNHWSFNPQDGGVISLVHRPDPDAEAVEALAKVMHDDRCADECCDGCDMGDYEHDAERIMHSARERGWDVVRRAES